MVSTKKISVIAQSTLLVLIAAFSVRAAGEVDTTFSGSAYGALTNQGNVNVVKLQPDGKILIGGMFTEVQGYAASGLARLNADGTVDRTFNTPDFTSINNGLFIFGGDIFAIAVQPDGKILVGGNIFIGVSAPRVPRKGIRRLNADGSIDSAFFTELMLAGSDVYDIKLQADGKILLGGLFTLESSSATQNLARLNADGTHDTTFSANTIDAQIKELEIQTDGKIVAGGFSGGTSAPLSRVHRFNTDGTMDSSFVGIIAGNGPIEAVELLADGKILVAGNFTALNSVGAGRVARLNTDGLVDTSFNFGRAGANAVVNDIAVRTDGKIIIGGGFSSFNGAAMQRIARLNTDGLLDNTFTNSGTITDTVVNDVELLPDNRILAGLNSSTLIDSLLRFSADGAFDSSFVVRATRGGLVHKILQQPDGKILVAGEFLYANEGVRRSMARFNADGTLDNSFVPYFNNLPGLPRIQAIALQPDGKIIVGASQGFVLQRLNPDGSQDTSFNTLLTIDSVVFDVALQPDGKILVAGNLTFPPFFRFARINTDGSLDTTFNPPQPNNFVFKIHIQPDGKFLIGGSFTAISGIAARNGIARYAAGGGLEFGFNPPPEFSPVVDMDLQADGKIVTVGYRIRRLNSNGTLDASLNQLANADVQAVKIQPDGNILVGGAFSMIGTTDRNGIARFKPNGTLDNGFTTFANMGVTDVQLQADGKILVGGAFTKIDGIPRARVARLLNLFVPEPPARTLFDYDGDGRADVSVFRPSTNGWFELLSGSSTVTEQTFGLSGDVIVPADFNGDRKTDIAIFRPSTGEWWYLSSFNNAQIRIQFGQSGDIPRPSDFDGDGKADFVLFRPSENNWYRLGSLGAVSIVNFGVSGDKPVTGDFDGDGKSDVAIYRPSTGTWWYRSSINNAANAAQFGISTDIPTAADYDGDGKTDLAVYRASTGTWYILNSSNGQVTILNFGLPEDKPTPADYDGDGKADIAVFRPSTGVWYLMRSTAGFTALQFGVSTDIPTPNAFVP